MARMGCQSFYRHRQIEDEYCPRLVYVKTQHIIFLTDLLLVCNCWYEVAPPAGRDKPKLVEPFGRWWERPQYSPLADGGASL